jgi:uncharacterized membrane protein YhaH (DUF805 family)
MSTPQQPDPNQPQYGQPPQAPQYPQAPPYGAPDYGQGAYGAAPNFSNVQRTPYLSGQPVDFMTAVTEGAKNIFTYEGRISRSAYWWLALAGFVVDIIGDIILRAGSAAVFLGIIIYLAVGLVTLSAAVRRLHDTDKSGWWVLIDLIPFVGFIWLIVLLCQPGTPGPNQYGNRV